MTNERHLDFALSESRRIISVMLNNVLSGGKVQDEMEPELPTNTDFFKRVLESRPPYSPGVESEVNIYTDCMLTSCVV